MEDKFKVTVNEKNEFHLDKTGVNEEDIQVLFNSGFHVLKGHRSFHVKIIKSEFLRKVYTIRVNSNLYEVKISDKLDQVIEEMGLSLTSGQVINNINAPMPGLILEVPVQPGDKVVQGDFLLVLEAMKMENTITAPRDGVVKSVNIKKGQTVEKNQLLIEME